MLSTKSKFTRSLIGLGAALCLLAGLLLPAPALAAPDAATITIAAPATVEPGEVFTVPLNISHVDALDTAQFDITFDSGVLTFDSASAGEIDGTTIPVGGYAEQSPGVWRVVQNVSGITGATGEGYLCEVHFTAGDSGSTEVNLVNVLLADADEKVIPVSPPSPKTVEVVSPTEPTIAFSPASLSFSATEGAPVPVYPLEIWNSGTGTLDWSVSGDATWLRLSPSSGSSTGEHDTVDVSVAISGMTGDYAATITIEATGATSKTVPVSLHISAAVTYYTLTVTCDPTAGGSVSLSPSQPVGGYEANSSVELTATPASGYAFGSWSSDLSGSTNPSTITMSSGKSVTANFVELSAPVNVDVTAADAGVDSITVTTKPVSEVTNIPSGMSAQDAYVVSPTGSGSFTLRFTDITNASDIVVYKVADSTWTELTPTVIDATTVEVSMEVGDPTLVFALPAPSGGVGGTAYPPDKLAILAPYILLLLGFILVGGMAWLVLRRRRAY